jgi:hypothetical protein
MANEIQFIDTVGISKEVARKFRVDEYHSNLKRGELSVRCPFCKDRKYHLGLSFNKNAYNCFKCSASGPLTRLLKNYGIPFRFKWKNEDNIFEENQEEKPKEPEIQLPIDSAEMIDKTVREKFFVYLQMRGIDYGIAKIITKLYPITDRNNKYFGYIIFPINKWSFYCRKFLKLTPNSPPHIIKKLESGIDRPMYFFHDSGNVMERTVLVVESIFNLLKAAQFGYSAVCTFGKGNWKSTLEFLKNEGKNRSICLVFDKDVKLESINTYCKKLSKCYPIQNLGFIDPRDMSKNDIAEMETRKELVELLFKTKNIQSLFLEMMWLGEIDEDIATSGN